MPLDSNHQYMTLEQAAELTHEDSHTLYQRYRKKGVPMKHEEKHSKGYRSRVLVPWYAVQSKEEKEASIHRLRSTDDKEFERMYYLAMLGGFVPYTEEVKQRVRIKSGERNNNYMEQLPEERDEDY